MAGDQVVTNPHQDQHGGVKVGSTLWGWFIAAGVTGLLAALLTARVFW